MKALALMKASWINKMLTFYSGEEAKLPSQFSKEFIKRCRVRRVAVGPAVSLVRILAVMM